ncbi:CYFA0S07e02916g1_1 [Cyberlindnera fabianii]|uniref:Very-long-chain (3R)-3-hydroxyacyl-CoA dehydratase n=1 Tax=Cyberlindnera fabianii TaxID=36022 RepID=A0A061AWE8_CYBFA|nr:CYFA0S07e02916g1_1 [Cyberlindnera fabianii]
MAQSQTPEQAKPVSRADRPTTKKMLARYNNTSALLWSIIFFNTIFMSLLMGQPKLFASTHRIVIIIQTGALYEVYNSIVGNVRSPVITTAMQVASRLVVVWGIFALLPNSPANFHWAYITLCLAWSVTEVVRYFYYAQSIVTNGNPPKYLTLLRYNLFFVLYPMGVGSELAIIYMSLGEAASQVGVWYQYGLIFVMLTYIPGFPVLFGHMLKQRKKVMKSLKADAKKQK